MLYKNYIITAAAIVESVFYHILFYYKKLKYQLYGKPILHDVKTYKEGEKTFVKVEGHKEKLNSPKEAVQDFHFLIISVLEREADPRADWPDSISHLMSSMVVGDLVTK